MRILNSSSGVGWMTFSDRCCCWGRITSLLLNSSITPCGSSLWESSRTTPLALSPQDLHLSTPAAVFLPAPDRSYRCSSETHGTTERSSALDPVMTPESTTEPELEPPPATCPFRSQSQKPHPPWGHHQVHLVACGVWTVHPWASWGTSGASSHPCPHPWTHSPSAGSNEPFGWPGSTLYPSHPIVSNLSAGSIHVSAYTCFAGGSQLLGSALVAPGLGLRLSLLHYHLCSVRQIPWLHCGPLSSWLRLGLHLYRL